MNTLTGICAALCAVCITMIIGDYLKEKRRNDALGREERREVLRMVYAADDDAFARQLARERAFREGAKL